MTRSEASCCHDCILFDHYKDASERPDSPDEIEGWCVAMAAEGKPMPWLQVARGDVASGCPLKKGPLVVTLRSAVRGGGHR